MNILATIGSGVVAFMIGALWYSVLFGKIWMKEVGITEEDVKESNGGAVPMIATLLIEIAVAFLVAFMITQSQLSVFYSGILIAGIAILSALKNYLFEQRSIKLIVINESYKFICIMIMTSSIYFFGK